MKPIKELKLEQVDRLSKMKLPEGWEATKLEVSFERKNIDGEWAKVIYDARNDTFYVHHNRGYLYPHEVKMMEESIEIMNEANQIIKK